MMTTARKYKHWVIVWTGDDPDICDDGVFRRKSDALKELEWWQGLNHEGDYKMVDMMLTVAEAEALNDCLWK